MTSDHTDRRRSILRRWRLQTRLIVIASMVLVLVGVGIGAASWLSVKTSLMSDLDSQLEGLTGFARSRHGPSLATDRSPGMVFASQSPEQVESALKFLFQPGVGDGALVAVDSGTSTHDLIAEVGRTQPQDLSQTAVAVLLAADDGNNDGDVSTQTNSQTRHQSVEIPEYGSYRIVAFDAGNTRTVYGVPQ